MEICHALYIGICILYAIIQQKKYFTFFLRLRKTEKSLQGHPKIIFFDQLNIIIHKLK